MDVMIRELQLQAKSNDLAATYIELLSQANLDTPSVSEAMENPKKRLKLAKVNAKKAGYIYSWRSDKHYAIAMSSAMKNRDAIVSDEERYNTELLITLSEGALNAARMLVEQTKQEEEVARVVVERMPLWKRLLF